MGYGISYAILNFSILFIAASYLALVTLMEAARRNGR